MSFELQEVNKADFGELVECMWYTYENPLQHLYRIFCPLNASGSKTRAEAVQESIDRFWSWHVEDPTSYWQKVTNKETGRIVGAALWKINRKDPYQNDEEHFEAYWHPEGGQRDFATQAFWQHEEARERMARRPHIYLNIIFVHPDFQRQGIASQILTWGINKAAELGVEMWLDAWQYGRPVYEHFGFTVIEHHRLKPTTEHPDKDWKACKEAWTDLETWVMWRPKEGPYVEGKSVKPWES